MRTTKKATRSAKATRAPRAAKPNAGDVDGRHTHELTVTTILPAIPPGEYAARVVIEPAGGRQLFADRCIVDASAVEREACAAIVDHHAGIYTGDTRRAIEQIAAEIRQRNENADPQP